MMRRIVFAFFLLAASFQCALGTQECDQATGNQKFSEGDDQAAFKALYDCELSDNVTGLSLAQSGFLYIRGFGVVSTDKARVVKYFQLFRRAAKLGNVDAITTVARIYESGDPSIKVKASPKTARCLDELVSSGSRNAIVPMAKVAKCLPD